MELPPDPPIAVSTNSPVLFIVDNLLEEQNPAFVPPGSRVCVGEALHYVGLEERWVFQGWSHGPTAACVVLTEPGAAYRALYAHQVLLKISSTVSGEQRSMWVVYGSPVEVEVAEAVDQGEGVRHNFVQWSAGERPFSRKNVIAPLEPTTLETTWVREYYVTVTGPPEVELAGSGWYHEGTSVILKAPDVAPGEVETERMKFGSWESVGFPALVVPEPENPVATIVVDAPYSVAATYEKQYRVVAKVPTGTLKREWLKAGEEIVLETEPVLETVPGQVRFVFTHWEGEEGLTAPKITGVITRAVELVAVYDRQVMVTVDAPHGSSGGGWHKVGSTVTVSVPESVHPRVMFRSSFRGFPGYTRDKPRIDLLVREPVAITALYSTEIDVGVLSLFLLLPLAAVLLYFGNRWVVYFVRQRAREPSPWK